MKLRTGLLLAFALPAMTLFSGYAETLSAEKNQPIQAFVASHYKELQDDLQRGDGASLTLLLNLLHTRSEEKDATVKRLRALSDAYPSPSEFADRVPDFVHTNPAPLPPADISSVPAANEPELVKYVESLKYKTRIHLTLVNGDERDGMFSSFDPSRKIIWIYPTGSSSAFSKKPYDLRSLKDVSLQR